MEGNEVIRSHLVPRYKSKFHTENLIDISVTNNVGNIHCGGEKRNINVVGPFFDFLFRPKVCNKFHAEYPITNFIGGEQNNISGGEPVVLYLFIHNIHNNFHVEYSINIGDICSITSFLYVYFGVIVIFNMLRSVDTMTINT